MEDEMTKNNEETIETINLIEDNVEIQTHTVETATPKINPVMIDFGNKMAIVYNVLKACIKEDNEHIYYYMDYMINRMSYLTNLPSNVLSQIWHKTKDPKKTDILEESVLETPDIDFLIRQTLVKCYIKNRTIPKAESLEHVINNHCYNYQLHDQLKKSGYIWRRLPNTKRAIIMEHPLRSLERQRYLQQIFNYRKENRPIVYIESKVLSEADKDIVYFRKYLTEDVNFIVMFIAIVNKNDDRFLGSNLFKCSSIYDCQKVIEDHIVKNILTSLPEQSVIILEDKPYYSKSMPVPTIESKKIEMIKWLEMNGIFCKNNLHRSELFALIQSCRCKRDLHSFDALIYSYGHEILRRPSRTEYLNYYKPLWENLRSTTDITTFISQKSSDYWKNVETSLIHIENNVYIEDLEMENITDKILTMADNVHVNKWADVECDEEEDSLAQEEFLIEIKNTFYSYELHVREKKFLSQIKKFSRISKK